MLSRSVCYPGVCAIQECVPSRSVCYPGVCAIQECVLSRSVYYRIFSKNSALHNFVTHSFVSKKSLKFDEMAISKTSSCSPIFRRPNFQPKINCRVEFKFCDSYSGSSSCALDGVFSVFAQQV